MGTQESELSLLDNPTGFLDHLESLNSQAPLSETQLQELVGLLTKEYHRADDLLRPEKFIRAIRPNGRPHTPTKSVKLTPDVQIYEALSNNGFVKIDVYYSRQKHWMIKAAFLGGPEDRRQLNNFFIRDEAAARAYSEGNHDINPRGFAVTISPPSLRLLNGNF